MNHYELVAWRLVQFLGLVLITGLQTRVGMQVWVRQVQVWVCCKVPIQNPYPCHRYGRFFFFFYLHITSVIFASSSTQMSATNLLFTYLLFVGTNILVFVTTITSQSLGYSDLWISDTSTISFISDILVTYVLHTSFISSLIITIPHTSYNLILSS